MYAYICLKIDATLFYKPLGYSRRRMRRIESKRNVLVSDNFVQRYLEHTHQYCKGLRLLQGNVQVAFMWQEISKAGKILSVLLAACCKKLITP